MKQLGFLDFDIRLSRIDKAGDPLTKINDTINWELFRPTLEQARKKQRKSSAGAKRFDVIMLFRSQEKANNLHNDVALDTASLLRLWFYSIGATKSDPNPGAIQVHCYFPSPLSQE